MAATSTIPPAWFPVPFSGSPRPLREVYDNFASDPHFRHWASKAKPEKAVAVQLLEERRPGVLERLRQRGVTCSQVGIDVTAAGLEGADVLADEDLNATVGMLVFSNISRLPRILWQVDQPQRRRAPPSASRAALQQHASHPASADAILAALLADGVARVHDWGLDMRALRSQSRAAIEEGGYTIRPDAISTRAPLPALEALLHNRALARAISSYLGGRARYDGHVLQRLGYRGGRLSRRYGARQWHHDRPGRRLKLFVFVDDVTEASHPTQVAAGSHNVLYWHYRLFSASRFTDAYVRSQHRVETLVGAGGGGFVFDTNSMHRGLDIGSANRTVVILEFHALGKVPALQRLGDRDLAGVPCPSWKGEHWQRGLPGYPLYPQDAPW